MKPIFYEIYWIINIKRVFFFQDQYSADLYHFATKEDEYASYFIRVSFYPPHRRILTDLKPFISRKDKQILTSQIFLQLLELQAEYHKASREFLERNISELKESHSYTGKQRTKRVIQTPNHLYIAYNIIIQYV